MGKGILNRGTRIHKVKTKYNRKTENNVSVFYCNSCDQLVDSDEAPSFVYFSNDRTWKCDNCLEKDGELNLLEGDSSWLKDGL